jgi:hypothetical protein
MRLPRFLYLSFAETFDPTNPWIERLAPKFEWKSRMRDILPRVSVLVVLPLLALAWIGALVHARLSDDPARAGIPLNFLTDTTTYILLMTSFVAPAIGVGARFRLDRSPLLTESLQTGLPWRTHVLAMHARVLTATGFAAGLAVLLYFALGSTLLIPHGITSQGVNSSKLSLLMDYIPMLRFGRTYSPPANAAALFAMAFMGANFVAGFYARASINAAVEPFGIRPVAVTVLLILAAMASFGLRMKPLLFLAAKFRILPADGIVFLTIAAIEGTCLLLRLWFARRAWARIERTGLTAIAKREGWQ